MKQNIAIYSLFIISDLQQYRTEFGGVQSETTGSVTQLMLAYSSWAELPNPPKPLKPLKSSSMQACVQMTLINPKINLY